MHINLFKHAKFGSLVMAGALAASMAHAATYNIGGFEVNMDTTLSVGSTWLTSDRNDAYLPEANGGNPNQNPTFGITNPAFALTPAGLAASACAGPTTYNTFCQEIAAAGSTRFNHDGSINSDDGRLNFDQGDIVSAPLKATLEFETRRGNVQAFLRTTMYWDIALMEDGSFERGGLTDKGENNAGREFNVLDAFVTVDGDAAGMPYMVRVGRQVINWGENTFIPGGNSSFNPIDVAALRRPGAEIKDALLPVEAIYGSLAVTDNLTLEAYYGGWDDYKLDAGGTLFGASDTFTPGSKNGNNNRYLIGGGSYSGISFACNTAALTAAGLTTAAALSTAIQATSFNACTDSPNVDVLSPWTVGSAEQQRFAAGEFGILDGANDEGDEAYGLAVRYYAENLNSTEFGLYYQSADSRLPYISYRTRKQSITGNAVGWNASTVGRGTGLAGLLGQYATVNGGVAAYNPQYNNIGLDDPHGLLSNAVVQATALAGLRGVNNNYNLSATANTIAQYQEIQTGLMIAQRNAAVTLGSPFDSAGQLPTGAITMGLNNGLSLFAEHPEIETWGVSFNTNIGGHTVQGDFSYRPDMPIQIDTDVLTINALFNACAFTSVGIFEPVYESMATLANERGDYNTYTVDPASGAGAATTLASGADSAIGCRETSYVQGYMEEYDVTSWNIGTTSIFTSSNPFVQFVGADVGILVTDFQGINVPDIYQERGAPNALAPSTNHCIGGSDLPLNGVLSIDDVLVGQLFPENAPGKCRSTNSSWGMTLLGSLQYNNAFGTPLTVSPQIVYQMGMDGRSPFPAGFWREGQGSAAFSMNVEYLGKWKGTLAYRDYLGDAHRTYNLDRNTVSVSLSYAF